MQTPQTAPFKVLTGWDNLNTHFLFALVMTSVGLCTFIFGEFTDTELCKDKYFSSGCRYLMDDHEPGCNLQTSVDREKAKNIVILPNSLRICNAQTLLIKSSLSYILPHHYLTSLRMLRAMTRMIARTIGQKSKVKASQTRLTATEWGIVSSKLHTQPNPNAPKNLLQPKTVLFNFEFWMQISSQHNVLETMCRDEKHSSCKVSHMSACKVSQMSA